MFTGNHTYLHLLLPIPGGPGSGREEYCNKIAGNYPGVVHVSMGDSLRENSNTETNRTMEQGDMLPNVSNKTGVPLTAFGMRVLQFRGVKY